MPPFTRAGKTLPKLPTPWMPTAIVGDTDLFNWYEGIQTNNAINNNVLIGVAKEGLEMSSTELSSRLTAIKSWISERECFQPIRVAYESAPTETGTLHFTVLDDQGDDCEALQSVIQNQSVRFQGDFSEVLRDLVTLSQDLAELGLELNGENDEYVYCHVRSLAPVFLLADGPLDFLVKNWRPPVPETNNGEIMGRLVYEALTQEAPDLRIDLSRRLIKMTDLDRFSAESLANLISGKVTPEVLLDDLGRARFTQGDSVSQVDRTTAQSLGSILKYRRLLRTMQNAPFDLDDDEVVLNETLQSVSNRVNVWEDSGNHSATILAEEISASGPEGLAAFLRLGHRFVHRESEYLQAIRELVKESPDEAFSHASRSIVSAHRVTRTASIVILKIVQKAPDFLVDYFDDSKASYASCRLDIAARLEIADTILDTPLVDEQGKQSAHSVLFAILEFCTEVALIDPNAVRKLRNLVSRLSASPNLGLDPSELVESLLQHCTSVLHHRESAVGGQKEDDFRIQDRALGRTYELCFTAFRNVDGGRELLEKAVQAEVRRLGQRKGRFHEWLWCRFAKSIRAAALLEDWLYDSKVVENAPAYAIESIGDVYRESLTSKDSTNAQVALAALHRIAQDKELRSQGRAFLYLPLEDLKQHDSQSAPPLELCQRHCTDRSPHAPKTFRYLWDQYVGLRLRFEEQGRGERHLTRVANSIRHCGGFGIEQLEMICQGEYEYSSSQETKEEMKLWAVELLGAYESEQAGQSVDALLACLERGEPDPRRVVSALRDGVTQERLDMLAELSRSHESQAVRDAILSYFDRQTTSGIRGILSPEHREPSENKTVLPDSLNAIGFPQEAVQEEES